MPSTLTWLDHSEHDRARVLEAIDRFSESETRDELGLGSLRDGFADLFFPGTSTIQTRAAYFLFIPWMYRQLEAKRVDAAVVAARARREEVRLRDALMNGDDRDGVLGKQAGASLKRLPSSVYWNGLGAWRIRKLDASQPEYHRNFSLLLERRGKRDDDLDLLSGDLEQTWDPHLPEAPADFPDSARMELRRRDAKYLASRIVFAAPDSLLSLLIQRGYTVDADFPWLHPRLASFPTQVRRDLEHARHLAETMHGAALLYNLMLSEQLDPGANRDERIEHYRGCLDEWVGELRAPDSDPRSWDRAAFWQRTRELVGDRPSARRFVEDWLNLVPWGSLEHAVGPAARELIRNREVRLKGGRARLGRPRALEFWNGASGAGRLEYRWTVTRRLLRDIQAGLTQEISLARAG